MGTRLELLDIPKHAYERLEEGAAQLGISVEEFALRALCRELNRPSVVELLDFAGRMNPGYPSLDLTLPHPI
jgi:hypothetical protein